MSADVAHVFAKLPAAIPLYSAIESALLDLLPDVEIRVARTQVSFYNTHMFACVSPPIRFMRNRPAVYVIFSFGLAHQVEHPRIAQAVQPYPNRWTHHVIVADVAEIDAQLLTWAKEAYTFSLQKGKHTG